MEVTKAQREIRSVYINGAVGQAVSGVIWLLSASLGTFLSVQAGVISLFVGGMFIFPLTQVALRLSGRSATVSSENPLDGLAMQVAFIVPLLIPVIGAAALYNINWYYPAFMVVVGVHYLPFVFLYGMKAYAVLAAVLIGGGVTIGWTLPDSFAVGGWVAAIALLVFSLYVWRHD
ncbi:hypothetical protein SAMN04487948_1447 [Halogranum amylolyticum]|uniref:Uncharacterized protein n=1 Tax=Halogranum amylolyticum TaxID=660520 RepID=A0A1H8WUF2_9EURY|nr:hypothetical protein [Halogranum amylolyticum]SEP31285.1 hypothetical protein SAMN04487948_1447 [Halogranum amylolyticum]